MHAQDIETYLAELGQELQNLGFGIDHLLGSLAMYAKLASYAMMSISRSFSM